MEPTAAQGESCSIVLNGEPRTVPSGTTLAGLVELFDLPRRGVAVEVSGEIAPRGGWAERVLRPGDRVELVHMVGGG